MSAKSNLEYFNEKVCQRLQPYTDNDPISFKNDLYKVLTLYGNRLHYVILPLPASVDETSKDYRVAFTSDEESAFSRTRETLIREDDRFVFTLPGLDHNARVGTNFFARVDAVFDSFVLWFEHSVRRTVEIIPAPYRPAWLVKTKDLIVDKDPDGYLIDKSGKVFICSNLECPNSAKHRVVVSEKKPHDSWRNYCDICYSAYDRGVTHGLYHYAAKMMKSPGKDDSQDFRAVENFARYLQ